MTKLMDAAEMDPVIVLKEIRKLYASGVLSAIEQRMWGNWAFQ